MASWLWVCFLDAFVYAHHKHRLDSANAGNFGDCLTRSVRFMTSISPAFVHAYQTICLAMHLPGVPHRSLRLPIPKFRYPLIPNDRSITRELGNDYHGWAIYTDGGTRVVDGEILAGWCAISDHLVGASLFCLVPSLPMNLILLSLVPELTPTTLLK